jgi:hypothetical protein
MTVRCNAPVAECLKSLIMTRPLREFFLRVVELIALFHPNACDVVDVISALLALCESQQERQDRQDRHFVQDRQDRHLCLEALCGAAEAKPQQYTRY